MLASVSDDKTLQVHDLRVPAKCEPMIVHEAHNDEISCVSFNLGAEVLLATGSYDSTIGIWDLRCLKDKLHACEGHKKGVSNIEWHPFVRQCLYSSGLDRRINIWNLSKTGEDQTPEDAEDGPPELWVKSWSHLSFGHTLHPRSGTNALSEQNLHARRAYRHGFWFLA